MVMVLVSGQNPPGRISFNKVRMFLLSLGGGGVLSGARAESPPSDSRSTHTLLKLMLSGGLWPGFRVLDEWAGYIYYSEDRVTSTTVYRVHIE